MSLRNFGRRTQPTSRNTRARKAAQRLWGKGRTIRKTTLRGFEQYEERRVLAVFNGGAAVTINSASTATPYPSALVVNDAFVNATIVDANITLTGLSHTFPDDIDALLVGPSGGAQNALIMSDAGGSNDISAVNLTFDDEAGSTLPDSAQIVSGTFQPSNIGALDAFPGPAPATAGTALSVFDGANFQGTWNLFINDDLGSDAGSLASWSLNLGLGGAVTISAGAAAANGFSDTFIVETVGLNTRVTVNGVVRFNEPSAGITSLLIQGSTDEDVVNILGTPANYTTTVEGAANLDTVNIGNANSVQGILGAVFVSNNPASTNINVNNAADATGRTATLSDGSLTGLAPGAIGWDPADLDTLSVNAGTGGDTINVTSTDASDPYIVNAGGGNDIFNITAAGLGTAGNLDVNGQDGNDTFNIIGVPTVGADLNIDGGSQTTADGDVINMNAYAINTMRHFLDTASSGRFEYDGDITDNGGAAEVVVDYDGLEPINDNGAVVNRVFDFGGGPDTDVAILDDGTAGNNITRIQAPLNAELVNFTTPTGTLTVNLGDGDDVISVNNFDSSFNTPTTNINGGNDRDELRIGVVPAGLTMNVNSGSGSPGDRTVVGRAAGTAVSFAQFNTGVANLSSIQGTLNIADTGGIGETYLDDSGFGFSETYTVNALAVVPTFGGPGLTVDLANTAGTMNVADDMDIFQLAAGAGADTINVNATTDNPGGTTTATFFGNAGADTFNIDASNLNAAGNNIFQGDANDDTFNVNITSGAAINAPMLIQGEANDFGAGVGSRDVVNINDNFGLGPVALAINYTGNVGGSEVTVGGLTNLLTIDTVETIDYDGAGGLDDTATVTGTPLGTDLITVAPITANRGLVFNNSPADASGPFDGPPQVWTARIPGVSGGSTRPDLDLSGIINTGLTIADTTAAADDRLYVYGQSTAGLNDGNTFDPFGFGAGQILPAVAEPASFDVITVTDTLTTVDALLRVNYNNTDFAQAVPNVTPAIVINSGFEGNPPATAGTDLADNISITLSANYKLQVNGGDPDPATTAIVPPDGDRLNVLTAVPVINVYSNKNPGGAPVVTIEFPGTGLQPFSFSSIENFGTFNATTVNLIGDNNDAMVDQNDNFVVVGGDTDSTLGGGDADGANEFTLVINGSIPIPFRGVQVLNVFGDDQNPAPGTPSVGPNHIDTFEVTPWAQDSSTVGQPPTTWGIESFFNEGNPVLDGVQADLIIYHTSTSNGAGRSISEHIVVQPSGSQTGEIRATNATGGSQVAVVKYAANTDIIVVDDDGSVSDTDTLTLRGTNPDTPGASGNDAFAVDFDAAGGVAAPFVSVTDAANGNFLYRLLSFTDPSPPANGNPNLPFATVTFEMLAGNDTLNFSPPDGAVGADPQFTSGVEQVNVFGGLGDDAVNVNYGAGDRHIWHNGRLFVDGGDGGGDSLSFSGSGNTDAITVVTYTPGPIPGNGRIVHSDNTNPAQVVDFVNLEPVIDTTVAANLIVNANNAANAINYTVGAGGATQGLVSIDNQESIEFSNKTVLTINALAGDDVISLNNPNTPTGLTGITVNGGDPTAGSDIAIVSGTTGADAINFAPTTDDDAVITGAGPVAITLATVESTLIDGNGGSDSLTYTSPAGNDILTYTQGATFDSGTITGFTNTGPSIDLMPLSFTGIGSAGAGALTFADSAAARTDVLYVQGSHIDDTFAVAAVSGELNVQRTSSSVLSMLPAATPGINQLILQGLDGDDTFNIPGNHPFAGGVSIEGGNPDSGSDVLNFTGGGAALAISQTADSITETGFGAVSYDGIEDINLNGAAAAVTVTGTAADDRFDITPTSAGAGNFVVHTTGAIVKTSPQFTYTNVDNTAFTVNGGAGGFDVAHIIGTEATDAITSTASTITSNGGTVTIGAGVDRADVDGLGSDDNINLGAYTATPANVRGGDGNDTIVGGSQADLLDGGAGNDLINGGGGDDVLQGGEGNDILDGDAGSDQMFGGAGSDIFVWDAGDGSDLIEGGAGDSDQLIFNGSAAAEAFALSSNGTRLSATRSVGNITLDVASVEHVTINASTAADTVAVNDLTETDVNLVNIDLGAADGAADGVTVEGRTTDDNLSITVLAGLVDIAGLPYEIEIANAVAGNVDRLTVNANEGNDRVKAWAGVENTIAITLNGEEGNDFLSADAILNGGAGDDFLEGGAGVDTINGNDGNDTMIGRGAADTFDGGAGFDTILVEGTPGNDIINLRQTADTNLQYTVNGSTENDTLVLVAGTRTVEEVRIEAGNGNDLIRVDWLDALGVDGAVNSLRITVNGGAPESTDRLIVVDDSVNDLTLYEKGEDDKSGRVVVGPGNAEPLENVFTGIDYVQFVDENGAAINSNASPQGPRLVVFKHDPFEFNNDRFTATLLGANTTVNVDPTINPGGLTDPFGTGQNVPGDEDWYRVEAEVTGTFDLQAFFEEIAALDSGRPGLPNNGNLNIELYDVDGTLVAGAGPAFGGNDGAGANPELNVDGDTFNEDERIRVPAVEGQVYFLRVFGVGSAINNYSLTIINEAAPVPFDIELDDDPANGTPNPPGQAANSDTGRSQFDNITYDATPTIFFRLDDAELLNDVPDNGANPGGPIDEIISIPFVASTANNAPSSGFRVAVFVESPVNGAEVFNGYATQVAPGIYSYTTTALTDGSHFITARVEMIDTASPEQAQGFGARSASLEIIVDTVAPPLVLGDAAFANDGLHPDSDSHVDGAANAATRDDNITNDTTPTFWGRAEADSWIRAYLDMNANGAVDVGVDLLIGQTTATPLDGTDQFPVGQWELTSTFDMNDPQIVAALGFDGARNFLFTAEDVAGNITSGAAGSVQVLNTFLDTQGPQIVDVDINNAGNPYDLFDPKPSTDGPTPLVNSLVISLRDLPNRTAAFLYNALVANIAVAPGHFVLKGDANGIIAIQAITLVNNPPVAGQPATATITLTFFKPLPDDRYTLTVSDSLVDPAGNALDGENNAAEPQENPNFPTGDSVPGGNFIGRFTVDSRAELAVWSGSSIYVDTNGNYLFDPTNLDATNRDISYVMGINSDNVFAGNFSASGDGAVADGFDKIAVYGRFGGAYRWLIDNDNDGVTDIVTSQGGITNGLPVAGNFDNNATNGDEVGLWTGTGWFLDTNHDYIADTLFAASYTGSPFVGDFDGDGDDDFGTWRDDQFFIDVVNFAQVNRGIGAANNTFEFGFAGVREEPISADFDGDNIDDIGLWVPDRGGAVPAEEAEWYIFMSNNLSLLSRIEEGPNPGAQNVIQFTPIPFGNDVFAKFGDDYALPVPGNFDPPVATGGSAISQGFAFNNQSDPLDVNGDGRRSNVDLFILSAEMRATGPQILPALPATAITSAPYVDPTRDNVMNNLDLFTVLSALRLATAAQNGEGETTPASLAVLSSSVVASLATPVAESVEPVASVVEFAVPSVESLSAANANAESTAAVAPATSTVDAALVQMLSTLPAPTASQASDLLFAAGAASEIDFALDEIASDLSKVWKKKK